MGFARLLGETSCGHLTQEERPKYRDDAPAVTGDVNHCFDGSHPGNEKHEVEEHVEGGRDEGLESLEERRWERVGRSDLGDEVPVEYGEKMAGEHAGDTYHCTRTGCEGEGFSGVEGSRESCHFLLRLVCVGGMVRV